MHSLAHARLLVRLSGDLAALLGRGVGDGRAVLYEDELLDALREKGLITYPSPLLGRLVEDLPEVFEKEVLSRLDPTGRALLARVGRGVSAAVVTSGLTRAGLCEEAPFKVEDFVGSVERLAWAKGNGCPWDVDTCARVAEGGQLEVLRWARRWCPPAYRSRGGARSLS